MAFGGVLRRHRLAAGLTQEALADLAGLGVRTIQALEEGEGQPRRATARHLTQALDLSEAERAQCEPPGRLSAREERDAIRAAAGLDPLL